MIKSQIIHILTPEYIEQGNICIMSLSKDEVDALSFFRFDESTFHLERAKQKARGILIPTFSFDHDSREVFEIPEVVVYAHEMILKCPQIFYYMYADAEVVRPFYLCLVDAFVLSAANGMAQVSVKSVENAVAITRVIIEATKKYAQTIGDKDGANGVVKVLKSFGLY